MSVRSWWCVCVLFSNLAKALLKLAQLRILDQNTRKMTRGVSFGKPPGSVAYQKSPENHQKIAIFGQDETQKIEIFGQKTPKMAGF